MATADKLLHDAQYAFASISYGESRANRRNRSRAASLCRKIIRKYPGSMEAAEALAILRRLGEESYLSELPIRHRHITQARHHGKPRSPGSMPLAQPRAPEAQSQPDARAAAPRATGSDETLDWGGLLGLLLAAPKIALGILVSAGFFLFSIFGPLLLFPLIGLVLFTGPFRSMLNGAQREQANQFIAGANAWIAERRRTGSGFS
jgi:hypothetical protein